MKKILIGLLASSIISSSAFAVEITHGKVLRHKEWTTGNIIKATYTNTNKTNLFSADITKLLAKKNTNDLPSSFTIAAASAQTGKAFEPSTASGISTAILTNNSTHNNTYAYTLETCIGVTQAQQNCAIFEDVVELEPNGMAFYTQNPSIQYTFDKAGVYPVVVRTIVESYGSDSNSLSMALGQMTISE